MQAQPDSDELRRVYAQLAAMRKNLSREPHEDDADRFHEQLDRLDRAGYDVAEHWLDPERHMYRRVKSSNSRTGHKTYAERRTIKPGVLEAKLDAILLYFTLAERNEPIGFAAPLKR